MRSDRFATGRGLNARFRRRRKGTSCAVRFFPGAIPPDPFWCALVASVAESFVGFFRSAGDHEAETRQQYAQHDDPGDEFS